METNNRKKTMSQAMAFIVLFGIVSLFSDMTHEGASSIRGAYLPPLRRRLRRAMWKRVWRKRRSRPPFPS